MDEGIHKPEPRFNPRVLSPDEVEFNRRIQEEEAARKTDTLIVLFLLALAAWAAINYL